MSSVLTASMSSGLSKEKVGQLFPCYTKRLSNISIKMSLVGFLAFVATVNQDVSFITLSYTQPE